MREDAPLYYDEKKDFHALTRHEDVAAAFKDFETYSSARGCDLAMVRRIVRVPGPALSPARCARRFLRNVIAEVRRAATLVRG